MSRPLPGRLPSSGEEDTRYSLFREFLDALDLKDYDRAAHARDELYARGLVVPRCTLRRGKGGGR